WPLVLGFSGYLLLHHKRGRALAFIVVTVTAGGAFLTASRGSFMWGMINALATSVAFIWGAPWRQGEALRALRAMQRVGVGIGLAIALLFIDRKSTRLNSSHLVISYAVFCLKKKKKNLSIILLL